MFQRPEQQPEVNLDQILAGMGSIGRRLSRLGGGGPLLLLLGFLFVIFAIWMATGIYSVSPSEQAVLRTFGKVTGTEGSGLHWFWPAPIGTRNVEKVTETRRMEMGFITGGPGGSFAVPVESLMITGDENIVDVQVVVQYKIKNLRNFLFRVADPGEANRGISAGRPEGRTLKDAAEVAIRQVVGSRPIDDVLTIEKENIQTDTQIMMQQLLDSYQAGIQVLSVKLQNVNPPTQVQDAFQDVVRAKEDKERLINLAEAYQEDVLPRARGQAEILIKAAEAFKAERIARAEGESARFLSVLEEYQKSKEVTRQRLYLEAMEEILPGITKFIVAADTGGNLLQFLPLQPTGVTQQSTGTSPTATPPASSP